MDSRMTDTRCCCMQEWTISQNRYDASEAGYYDSIFFQGNGYVGARGFQDEFATCEDFQRTTFMSGVYEYIKNEITDMVNTPDFFSLNIAASAKDGRYISVTPEGCAEGSYRRELSLRDGILSKGYRFAMDSGVLEIAVDRFLSLDDVHAAAQKLVLTSSGYEGDVEAVFTIDGSVRNNTVNDEQLKKDSNPVSLLVPVFAGEREGSLLLEEKTPNSGITLAEAMGMEISAETQVVEIASEVCENKVSFRIRIHLAPGGKAELVRKVSICTSRDPEKWEDPVRSVLEKISALPSWDTLRASHTESWERRWRDSDVRIEGDSRSQLEIRFAVYNLISNCPAGDPTCSIGARGLTHGRYKGCYFWDTEMYMLPFYLLTNPGSARNLLLYRWNTLGAARAEARRFNLPGARYSWMCTPDGREQCETWDTGSSEIHITADVAYAIDLYWRVTGDDDFAAYYGLEMLIEICRYWTGRFSYDARSDRYNLLWVKGPDEYCGVTVNNTYTVTMAVFGFEAALRMMSMVREKYPCQFAQMSKRIGFQENEISEWNKLTSRTNTGYDSEKHLFLEDDLFMLKEPVDVSALKSGDEPLYKTICFDRLQRMRVLKQADVLLLMGLLPERYTDEEKKASWEFYEPITLHDSTLSFGTHAWTGAMFGYDEKAFQYFQKSAGLDLRNLMGNTAEEGLHLAAFGGTWMAAVLGFAGLDLRGGEIALSPRLPASWESVSFPFFYKGKRYTVQAGRNGAAVWETLEKEA